MSDYQHDLRRFSLPLSPRLPALLLLLSIIAADSYDLWAIVLMRPPINDEASVIVSPTYTTDLNEAGYIYGIFRRNGIESK